MSISAARFVLPFANVVNGAGSPISGAQLYFYVSGASTPAITYADPNLTIPNANPVVANGWGRFSNIFLDPSVTYKVSLFPPQGNTQSPIWTADPVSGAGGSGASGNEVYTSNFATPIAADAFATANGAGLVVDSPYTFTQAETFNASTVRFVGGSDQLWTRGINTLTIMGAVFAPESPLFDAVATPIKFSQTQGTLYARWFGVVADDTINQFGSTKNPNATDDTPAWQACYGSAALNGPPPEVIWPEGVSKVSDNINIIAPLLHVGGATRGINGVLSRGRGGWTSIMQSYLSSGDMVTVGWKQSVQSVAQGNRGYKMENIGFSSAGSEDKLVNVDNGVGFEMTGCAFQGGNNIQLYVGRAEYTKIHANYFQGYFGGADPVSGATIYGSHYGIIFGTDSAGRQGSPGFITNNTITGFRTTSHDGCAVWLQAGGEHRVIGNAIEDADILVRDDVSRTRVTNNEMETGALYLVLTPNVGNTGNGTFSFPGTVVFEEGPFPTNTATFDRSLGYDGTYNGAFTSPVSYTLTDPAGTVFAGTVGTTLSFQGMGLLITAGSTAWNASDTFVLSSTADRHIYVGTTSRSGSNQYTLNSMSADRLTNGRLFDLVSYAEIGIFENSLLGIGGALGVVCYFGADDNGQLSLFERNIGINPRTQMSILSTDGKWKIDGNIENSTTPGYDLLKANSVTPAVSNLVSADTANTVATTITNFAQGYAGQSLILRIRDNLTTIQNGTPLQLALNQNFVGKIGDVLRFVAWEGTSASSPIPWTQVPFFSDAPVPSSTGTMTIKSGNANNANNAGFVELFPGIWVPYFTDPTP